MSGSQLIDNFLTQSYHSLRENDRFIQEQGAKSRFESFWETINNAFSMGLRGYHPPNYTVESFYRGTLDVNEFRLQVRETVIDKNLDKLDANVDPILTISWELYSSVMSRKALCSKIPRLCCRQLWGVFNKLDCDCSGFAMIDDIVDVISNIYKANSQEETTENIKEWFCDQKRIDFWSFFSALVETHDDLLNPSILQSVYDIFFFEILKEGKMKKKGHKVANWKERWFVLSSTQLCYYKTHENRSLQGSVVIGKNSKVEKLFPTKDHPYLFRVTDGKSGVPYDLSAHDPQIMCDWIQKLQVTAGAYSEEGYSVLHKLRLAENRLFPYLKDGKPLPAYKQSGASEYNEGLYRVVQPSTKIGLSQGNVSKSSSFDNPTPLPPLPASTRQPSLNQKDMSNEQPKQTKQPESRPLDSPPPIPTYEAVKFVSGPKIKPYKSDDTISLTPVSSPEPTYVNVNSSKDTISILESELEPMSPTLLPITIQQQRTINGTLGRDDRYINVQHVNIGGQDYALVDKGQVQEEDTVNPPPPPPPRGKGFDNEHDYVNVPNSNSSITECNYAVVENGQMTKEESRNISPSHTNNNVIGGPPVAKKRTIKPSLSDSSTPSPPYTKSNDSHIDYTTLDFINPTEPAMSNHTNSKVHDPSPKPRSIIPKTRFEYAKVILEDTTVKDVDKALQLKANRPPPTPPSRYNPKQTSNLSTSPSRQEFQPIKPVLTKNSSSEYTPKTITATSPSYIDLDPPPPPPRRITSKHPPVVPPR